MKAFFADFKKFALRGNIVDLAIAVVLGTAFNSVINSLVTNVITPPLGLLLGRIDFTRWELNLGGSVNIHYGLFIQSVITFITTAFALFLIIRFVMRLERLRRKEQQVEEEQKPKTPELLVLEEIRDSLKRQSEKQTP